MRPADSASATCRFRSPCRSPFGKSKKRTRGSAQERLERRARVVLDAVADDEQLDRRSLLGERALHRVRQRRRVAICRNENGRVDHGYRTKSLSRSIAATTSAPSSALDFGGGPPLEVPDERPQLGEQRQLARRLDALAFGLCRSRAKDRHVRVPAACERGGAVRAMQLDRPAVLRHSRRHGERVPRAPGFEDRLHVENLVSVSEADRATPAAARDRGSRVRSRGRGAQVPRRCRRRRAAVPSRPASSRARARGRAAPSGRSPQARERPGDSATCPSRRAGRPRARSGGGACSASVQRGFSTKTGTPWSSAPRRPPRESSWWSRRRSRRRLFSCETSATTALAPPSCARATLASERATTGTEHPSERRSRRMFAPQRPHPTRPTTMARP